MDPGVGNQVDLAARPDRLDDVTRRGEIVLDGFLGSGTLLLACERTGRRARRLEIDPAYVDVAVERWVAMTGREAGRLSMRAIAFELIGN